MFVDRIVRSALKLCLVVPIAAFAGPVQRPLRLRRQPVGRWQRPEPVDRVAQRVGRRVPADPGAERQSARSLRQRTRRRRLPRERARADADGPLRDPAVPRRRDGRQQLRAGRRHVGPGQRVGTGHRHARAEHRGHRLQGDDSRDRRLRVDARGGRSRLPPTSCGPARTTSSIRAAPASRPDARTRTRSRRRSAPPCRTSRRASRRSQRSARITSSCRTCPTSARPPTRSRTDRSRSRRATR